MTLPSQGKCISVPGEETGPEAKLASVLLSCHFLHVQSRAIPSWLGMCRLCRTTHTGTGMCDSRRKDEDSKTSSIPGPG